MASTDMTLHIELSGLDRDLLERVCENLEWYRKHLQEHRSEAELWRDPQVKAATLEWYRSHFQADMTQAEQEAEKSVHYDDWGIPIQEGEIG